MNLSIIVPCYNESANLEMLLSRFREVVGSRPGVEVVLVDNGSTDDSPLVLGSELARPENHFARSVRVEINQGYGHGIMSGLRSGTGRFLAWTHADLQTDPQDVMLAYNTILRAANPENAFVRGRRIGRGWFDAAFTGGMSLVSSLALGVALRDINAQPKLFHRSFLDRMTDPPNDFALDLYALYQARMSGMDIFEQPVYFGKRHAGEAKGGGTLRGKWKLSRRAFHYILALRRKLKAARSTPVDVPFQRAA